MLLVRNGILRNQVLLVAKYRTEPAWRHVNIIALVPYLKHVRKTHKLKRMFKDKHLPTKLNAGLAPITRIPLSPFPNDVHLRAVM
jgi:hypothetical protein